MSSKKGNPVALLPLVVFLLLFIGTAVITKDFSKMPVIVAFLIASGVAFLMNREVSMSEKTDIFTKGAGEPNLMLMCIIFILAGAFASVARAMGGVDSTVNLGLSLLPQNILMAGMFIIACFISISMGTSMGTIVALAPIGIGLADKTGIPVALAVGAVVGGAMFGDNLSMISDTTIAATRTQGCEMKDKFKTNFLIVLPAAIITTIILAVITSGGGTTLEKEYPYEIIKVVPYLAVLVVALMGVNVITVLAGGTVFAGIIGWVYGDFDFFGFVQAAGQGIMGMEDLAMIAIIIGGLVELIKYNGGIDFVIEYINSKIKTKKGAELGIAALVSLIDICTANNTISIIMAGPLAKNIADEYDIDPRRSASLLDLFSCCFQGIVPYGGQLLVAAGLASISPLAIMKYMYYPILIGICGLIAIAFDIPKIPHKTIKTDANL